MQNTFLTTSFEIIQWLDLMGIQNYYLIDDQTHGFVVNVKTEVNLKKRQLMHLPVKFGTVDSHFVCSSNSLISLRGAPDMIKGGLYCASNNLRSLDFLPARIDGNVNCANNPLLGDAQQATNLEELLFYQAIEIEKKNLCDQIESSTYCALKMKKI